MARVIVVGAGLAGLSAAHELAAAGCEVELLERARRAGGRVATERRAGFVVEHGPTRFRARDAALRALVRAMGLEARWTPIEDEREQTLRAGRFHASDWRRPRELAASRLLPVAAKARLSRLLLAAWRGDAAPDERIEACAAADDTDAATLLRRTVGADASALLFEPALAATLGVEPEHASRACALPFLAPDGAASARLEGGMDVLPRALAKAFAVRLGWEVVAVEPDELGVRVHYVTPSGERTLRGEAAVLAVPAPAVPGLCGALTDGERGFFEQVRMIRSVGASLLFEKAPEALGAAGRLHLPRGESPRVARLEHLPAPRGGALVRVALHPAAANQLAEASDEHVVREVLGDLARTPIGTLAPSEAIVHRWDPMLPLFHPGAWRRLAAFHARHERTPRIAFAGDALAGPSAEGAVESGAIAARALAPWVYGPA